ESRATGDSARQDAAAQPAPSAAARGHHAGARIAARRTDQPIARTAAMNASCPISTPTLKKSSASGTAFCGTPTSLNAPAKPKPCNRPNENATSHGKRVFKAARASADDEANGWRASSDARNKMLSAIVASTGAGGTCAKPI